jgi:2-dehydro-3-deoxy-D-arabinonate dehydratase
MTKLFRTPQGWIVEHEGSYRDLPDFTWSALFEGLDGFQSRVLALPLRGAPVPDLFETALGAPIEDQEVWAAGVTYLRSKTARVEESSRVGGGSVYDRVYEAERPELFLKSTGWRVVGHRGRIRARRDASWTVPEPELALVVDPSGRIIGYTIGNDVSSRDIEGENPLYLPQAKFYDGACALGPAILLADGPLPASTEIGLRITRDGGVVFSGATTLAQMKRSPEELVGYLYRETSFPRGSVLLTGTGIVPDDDFTLQANDEVAITIEPIGTLVNVVA